MRKGARLLLCCCSMLLVRSNVCAESISFARAIELSKKQVAGVGSTVDDRSGCRPERIAAQPQAPDVSGRPEPDCESVPGAILEASGCQDFRPRWTGWNSETLGLNGYRSGGVDEGITNTARDYIQLAWAIAQLSARKQQHELARRLVAVERMRARAGVDDDVVLYRAKLLEAQIRMRTADTEGEVLALRHTLAARIGVSETSLDIVPDSVPALPTTEDLGGSVQLAALHDQFELLSTEVKEQAAARDAAQLAYYLARRDATRMSATTTGTLGEQITSQIRAEEKFGMLLSEIVQLQQSELTLLVATGDVEQWIADSAQPTRESLVSEQRSPAGEQMPAAEGSTVRLWEGKAVVQGVSAPLTKKVTPSSKRDLMVLPGEGKLTVGECKQFAAVGVADGKGNDVTSLAKWFSSNESVAIVSTSGLVTALRTGKVVIRADLDGVSRPVQTTVVENQR